MKRVVPVLVAAVSAVAVISFGATVPGSGGFFGRSDAEIDALLKQAVSGRTALPDRIAAVSAEFLGIPYKLGPLGEGPDGEFDRYPLISFRQLDCTTFVEEAMALSLEGDLAAAERTLRKIRYKNGVIGYETRNHFPELDWIPNNVKAGYIRDITREVAGDKTRSVSRILSKSRWYSEKTEKDLLGFEAASPKEREALVRKWRELGKKYPDQKATLDYLPIEALPELLAKIPSGTILNLVRDPSSREKYPILVSHQALFIDTPRGKMVRNAVFGQSVEDVPALEYFKRYDGAPWRLLGLNLDEIRRP